VALLADRASEFWFQMPRIDDRKVNSSLDLLAPNVQFTGAVAPLATDCLATEDRLLIPIDRVFDRQGAVRMTIKTAWLDRAIEVKIVYFKAR
jgi:hypothetical protein